VVVGPAEAEITTRGKQIFPGMKMMFWTCMQPPFRALPHLTQDTGWCKFWVSQHNGEGGFPLSSQDRLGWAVKPEKQVPAFRAIIIFAVNPKMSGC